MPTADRLLLALLATTAAAQTPPADQVPQWFGDPFSAVLAKARAEDRPVAAYFWAEGSDHCARLWNETLSTGPAAAELAELVCYSADARRAEPAALLASYGVQILPTVLVLDSRGRVEDRLEGHLPTAEFLQQLRRIKRGDDTVGTLRAAASADPDDLDLRFRLALKLRTVGDPRQADGLFASIHSEDPEGETVGGAELLLLGASDELASRATGGNPADPAPLREVLPKLRHPSVRAKAFDRIAFAERNRGDGAAARQAVHDAWQEHRGANRIEYAHDAAFTFWEMRAEVEPDEVGFLLESLEQPARDATGSLDDGSNTASIASLRTLRAYACAAALAGDRRAALAALDRALRIRPDDPELQAVRRLVADRKR